MKDWLLMDRIFQNYEGEITEFTGLRFSQVKSFIDEGDNDIILLWFKVESTDIWYRVFIDGEYCGVDKYYQDESEVDCDDLIRVEDHSLKFHNQKIVKTEVVNAIKSDHLISLIIRFDKSVFTLVCLYDTGTCTLLIE